MQVPTEQAITHAIHLDSYKEWYKDTLPQNYVWPRHVEWICDNVVQPLIDGEFQRVCLTAPPQHIKSDTIARRLPVYWGGMKFPGDNALLTGYSQRFAEKQLSEPAREFSRELGLLAPNSTALDSWSMLGGSNVAVRGIGSPPTGIPRLKLIIVDDPINSREVANSEIMRENIWEYWRGSLIQRAWPDTRIVLCLTRWHHDDLAGRLMASDDAGLWKFINLPAIAEENDPMGREVGEALWPELKPIEFLEQIRQEIGEFEFQSLFQGNPTPREGAMFKVSQITFVQPSDVPKVDSFVAFDLGSTTKGDYTYLCETWKCPVSGRIYQDYAYCQLEPFERNKWMREQVDLRKPNKVRGPQDPGAAGKESAQNFVRLMSGYNVVTKPVTGDKETRAEPLAAQVNAGMVYFVDSPGSRHALEQFRQFPLGKHDDAVDAGVDSWLESSSSNSGKSRSKSGDFF